MLGSLICFRAQKRCHNQTLSWLTLVTYFAYNRISPSFAAKPWEGEMAKTRDETKMVWNCCMPAVAVRLRSTVDTSDKRDKLDVAQRGSAVD